MGARGADAADAERRPHHRRLRHQEAHGWAAAGSRLHAGGRRAPCRNRAVAQRAGRQPHPYCPGCCRHDPGTFRTAGRGRLDRAKARRRVARDRVRHRGAPAGAAPRLVARRAAQMVERQVHRFAELAAHSIRGVTRCRRAQAVPLRGLAGRAAVVCHQPVQQARVGRLYDRRPAASDATDGGRVGGGQPDIGHAAQQEATSSSGRASPAAPPRRRRS
jgi:hypothetical protein